MRKTVQLLIALVLIVSISMPKLSNAASDDLVVTGKILNLREGPGLSYPILDELKEGDTLSTIEKSGDWIHVKSGNTEGWVASWLTKPLTEKESAETSKIIVSQVDHLNVRAEPSLSAAVLAQLFLGNEANYIKSENDWIQIQFGTVTGWVSSQYITIKDRSVENNQSPVAPTAKGNLFTVTVDAVNVRKKADLTSKRITSLTENVLTAK